MEGQRVESKTIDFSVSKFFGMGWSVLQQASQRWKQYTLGLCFAGLNQPSLYINADTNGVDIETALTLAQTTCTNGDTLDPASKKSTTVNQYASPGGSATLPILTGNLVGTQLEFINPQAVAFSLASGGGESIIGAGASATSFSVAARTTAYLRASNDQASIGLFWAVYG